MKIKTETKYFLEIWPTKQVFEVAHNPETGEEYQKEVVPIALSCAKCKKSLVYSPYNKDGQFEIPKDKSCKYCEYCGRDLYLPFTRWEKLSFWLTWFSNAKFMRKWAIFYIADMKN